MNGFFFFVKDLPIYAYIIRIYSSERVKVTVI